MADLDRAIRALDQGRSLHLAVDRRVLHEVLLVPLSLWRRLDHPELAELLTLLECAHKEDAALAVDHDREAVREEAVLLVQVMAPEGSSLVLAVGHRDVLGEGGAGEISVIEEQFQVELEWAVSLDDIVDIFIFLDYRPLEAFQLDQLLAEPGRIVLGQYGDGVEVAVPDACRHFFLDHDRVLIFGSILHPRLQVRRRRDLL